ncbi:MAG TPA: sulfatase-like hydrolase/transferase [Pseudobacteroides sp.]
MVNGMQLREIKRSLVIIILNILSSTLGVSLFILRIKQHLNSQNIKLIDFSVGQYKMAIYQPFYIMLLIWLAGSVGFLYIYIFQNFIKKSPEENDSHQLFKKFSNITLQFVKFFIFVGSFIFIAELVTRQNIKATLAAITTPSIMFNFIVLSTITLFLTGTLGKFLSKILVVVVMTILIIANFIKFIYFDEPFYPWDMYLINEGIRISKEYVNLPLIFSILFILVVGFIILLILKKNIRNRFKPKLLLNILPFALILLVVNGLIINSPKQLVKLGIAKSWYIGKQEMQDNGLLVQSYMYIKNYKHYTFSKPEGYSKEKLNEITTRLSEEFPQNNNTQVKPNVVLIMSESFWDPTRLKNISFNEDIMKGFSKYKKGDIVSPAIGGGTANVEFEALTGLSNYFFQPGILTYNVYIRRNTPGLASVFKDNGYETIAVHPFLAEMYNRNKVYKFLQFDKFLTSVDFDIKKDVKGPYVSDEKFKDKILELLSTEGKPKFIFGLTMQNHDPYVNKYNKLTVTAKSDKLNEDEKHIISTYAEGIKDSANALDELIQSIKASGIPTIVYFFGDHLPRFGTVNDMKNIYNRLNPESDPLQKEFRNYLAPYASWSNIKETRKFDKPFSPSHIAFEILKDSGVKYPSYFNVLKGLEEKNLYLHQTLSTNIDTTNQYFKDYKMIEYDIINGKQYLLDK